MKWSTLKRLGWALMIFVLGVFVGGDFPTWVVLSVPCAAVAWLIAYSEVSINRVKQEMFYNNYQYKDYEDVEVDQ